MANAAEGSSAESVKGALTRARRIKGEQQYEIRLTLVSQLIILQFAFRN